jgi:dTDP-4-amino-4,6-dideoxygalactose transaminase
LTTGPAVESFEAELTRVIGKPAVTVTSGTAALHCAFAAIGIHAGDEVITPPLTFVATQATAALLGAKIRFADIDAETHNLDPVAAEKAITAKTKAIVAVDYAGHPADMDELRKIADNYGLFLIEDAAHSIGSTYKNRPVGTLADLTTFSFFPTKNFTTGEGGAISSANPELLARARRFGRQGLIRDENEFKLISDGPWHQEVHEFGLNYRLPDILCALGISQIKKLAKYKQRRREIFNIYQSELSGFAGVLLPIERDYVESNWHLFAIQVAAPKRKKILTGLRESGIGAQVNYIPAYRHPVFASENINPENFPRSEHFYNSEISLPMHYALSNQEVTKICDVLKMLIRN